MELHVTDIMILIIIGVFTVLWYLLRQKDQLQEKQIALLFEKHDLDAAALAHLQLDIARKHYQKDELDIRMEKLDATFRIGFESMGLRFDRLSEVLTAHVMEHQNDNRRNS